MKDLRKMSREDLENVLDKVDAKNSNVVGVKKAGTVSKTETYSTFWVEVLACNSSHVTLTIKTYTPYADREHHAVLEDILCLSADCPADSLDAAISTCEDVINAKTFKDKADVLDFNIENLAAFPIDVDIFYLLKKKYLTDLKAELTGKCFDIPDDGFWIR